MRGRAPEMAQQLRAHTALATMRVAHKYPNSQSGEANASVPKHLHSHAHIEIHHTFKKMHEKAGHVGARL